MFEMVLSVGLFVMLAADIYNKVLAVQARATEQNWQKLSLRKQERWSQLTSLLSPLHSRNLNITILMIEVGRNWILSLVVTYTYFLPILSIFMYRDIFVHLMEFPARVYPTFLDKIRKETLSVWLNSYSFFHHLDILSAFLFIHKRWRFT